jgi:acyl-CoA dehydrogenase
MDFALTPRMLEMQSHLQVFIDRHILPANVEWHREVEAGRYPMPLLDRLKDRAKGEGLWNLFLPGLREDEPGTRLNNLEYAPLAEIMGRLPWCSEVFNCSAPDTGNMELLHLFATEQQREHWLIPLLEGQIRSCIGITEPDTASSDPTNLQTSIRREGTQYVINGRKWFTSGALHPNAKFVIVMGLSDSRPDADSHARHSMVVVPLNTPGLKILRNVAILNHLSPEGHCEITYRDVRVPISNLVGEEGKGFALAQARLGPGRVHHCMRTIGQCEVALELMCERALERKAFGKHLADFANIQDWIAKSRIEIEQARLLTLRAAWMMDRSGNKSARTEVAAIKVVAARLQTRVVDRAIQVFGAMGLTPDTPLAFLYTWGRALRFIDGPDEVHLRSIAREELKKAKRNRRTMTDYLVPPLT